MRCNRTIVKNVRLCFLYMPVLFTAVFLLLSCSNELNDVKAKPQDDSSTKYTRSVNTFIWKAMNEFYVWKNAVPDLADNIFGTPRYDFLISRYGDPAEFFESLVYNRKTVDKFSFITDDYDTLDDFVRAESSHGAGLILTRHTSSNNVTGVIGYIAPNSYAATATDLKRGDMFLTINGTPITTDNYRQLLSLNTMTLGMAKLDNRTKTVSLNGKEKTLKKVVARDIKYVIADKILDRGTTKVGYFMYSSFRGGNSLLNLNALFGKFKKQGVAELVVDLRYNGGGLVSVAQVLASLITGQFTDRILVEHKCNDVLTNRYPNHRVLFIDNLEDIGLKNEPLNSLELTRVFIIAGKSSASASEIIINGLDPYINVIHVGGDTYGKNMTGHFVYDVLKCPANKPNCQDDDRVRTVSFFKNKKNVFPRHRYALNLMISTIANASGRYKYYDGLKPDIYMYEDTAHLGELGQPNEPLLERTLKELGRIKSITTVDTNTQPRVNPGSDNMYFFDYDDRSPLIFTP